jgi:hypothetical protein
MFITKYELLINYICEVFIVEKADILSKSRLQKFVTPRHWIMYFIFINSNNISLKKIAQLLNRKDHTTVINAIKKIQYLIYHSYNDRLFLLRHEDKVIEILKTNELIYAKEETENKNAQRPSQDISSLRSDIHITKGYRFVGIEKIY